jgi:hypothetical protein
MARVFRWSAGISLSIGADLAAPRCLRTRAARRSHRRNNADFLAFQSFVRSNPPPSQPAISYSSKLLPALNFLINIGDLGGPGSGLINSAAQRVS